MDVGELRKKRGISQEKLAELIGVAPRTIQNYESGGKIPDSKSAILRSVLCYPNTDEHSGIASHGNLIPFYDNVSSIGGNNDRIANMDSVSEPTEYIDAGDWFKNATAAIRHYGDSMTEYPPGCILALKEVIERQLVVWGKDYVIETNEYRVTKRVQRGNSDDHIRAYSSNTEAYPDGRLIHEPLDIAWNDVGRIFLVLGYVVNKNGGTMLFNKSE